MPGRVDPHPGGAIRVKPLRDTSPPRSGTVEEIDLYVGSPEETGGVWGEWLTDVSDALDYAWKSLPTINLWEEEKDKLSIKSGPRYVKPCMWLHVTQHPPYVMSRAVHMSAKLPSAQFWL